MGPDPKLFDDIIKMAGGAANVAGGLHEQVREEVRVRLDDFASRMNLVPREDLDQALAMIEKLRERVDAIEAQLEKVSEKNKPNTKEKA
jgi:BMFP domain-containing protein YqiC